MNSSTIAILFGAVIASAGVTYFVTSEANTPLPTEQPAEKTPAKTSSPSVSTTPAPSSRDSRGSDGQRSNGNITNSNFARPDGIDEKTWEDAQNRARMFATWANRARESGWMEQRIKERVERDSKNISDKLGLQGPEAEKVQKLLTDRMEASTKRGRDVFDAMLTNEEGMATLLAVREMKEDDKEIPASLEATKESLKKDMFGQFYPEGGTLSDDELMGLFRPTRTESWYKDDEFLVSASAELGGSEGASLVDYAGKMDYLDRQDDAQNRVNRIERTVDLQPQQTKALEQLYIDHPSPSDQQISNIVGQDKVEAVKSSSSDGGRGGWGRGRGRR